MRSAKELKNIGVNEGDLLRLTYSNSGNAYTGFEGIVKLDDGYNFSLFSGHSWLTNLNLRDCKFEIIKRNETGLFVVNGVQYYSESSVMHKPVRCSKCKFIPVEYLWGGIFKATAKQANRLYLHAHIINLYSKNNIIP